MPVGPDPRTRCCNYSRRVDRRITTEDIRPGIKRKVDQQHNQAGQDHDSRTVQTALEVDNSWKETRERWFGVE